MTDTRDGRGAIVVLGMQRSGTSCLAGMLAALGATPPGPVVRNWENPRGYFEALSAIRLNEEVLAHSGGHWLHAPPAVRWTTAQAQARDVLLADRNALLKDPRSLLTLPFWQSGTPQPRWIGIIRHPLAVAHSLLAWRQMPLAEGLALWRAHNVPLLEFHAACDFPLLDFELPGPEFIATVATAAERLGLPVELDRLRAVYAHELVHHGREGGADDATVTLYEQLRARCLKSSATVQSVRPPFPWEALADLPQARAAVLAAADPTAVIVPLIARLLNRKQAAAAVALLHELENLPLPSALSGLLMGKSLLALGRPADAVSHLANAAAGCDSPFEAHTLLAHALHRSGHTAEAIAILRVALPQALYPHTVLATIGEWAHEQGDTATAIARLTEACAAAPARRQGRLLTRLAEWHHAAGDVHRACALLRQARQVDPGWKRAAEILQRWGSGERGAGSGD